MGRMRVECRTGAGWDGRRTTMTGRKSEMRKLGRRGPFFAPKVRNLWRRIALNHGQANDQNKRRYCPEKFTWRVLKTCHNIQRTYHLGIKKGAPFNSLRRAVIFRHCQSTYTTLPRRTHLLFLAWWFHTLLQFLVFLAKLVKLPGHYINFFLRDERRAFPFPPRCGRS